MADPVGERYRTVMNESKVSSAAHFSLTVRRPSGPGREAGISKWICHSALSFLIKSDNICQPPTGFLHTHTHIHSRWHTDTGICSGNLLSIPCVRLWSFVLPFKAWCLKLCSKTAYLLSPVGSRWNPPTPPSPVSCRVSPENTLLPLRSSSSCSQQNVYAGTSQRFPWESVGVHKNRKVKVF